MSATSAASAERRKMFSWLTIENVAQLAAMIVALSIAFGNVKSDVRDVNTQDENRRLILEMSGDIKVLLERTKPKGS